MNEPIAESVPAGGSESPSDAPAPEPVFSVSGGTRVWLLLMNWIPVTHVVLVGLIAWAVARWSLPAGIGAGVGVLYLLPPVVVRFVLLCYPIAAGKYGLETWAFRVWWLTAQWQALFNRLPMLEEAVRLVPCAYSMWLRLWGSRVGRMVFWSPGTVVLDRSFVRIGDRCVMGIGVRLHPHLIARGKGDGAGVELWLAPVLIGPESMVGGFSLLAPGVRVAPCSVTPAVHALPAFSEWQAGRRTRRVRPTIV